MTAHHGPRAFRGLFAAETSAVGKARGTVERTLRDWGLPDTEGRAVLLTSEVMTNAVRHASGPVELVILAEGGTLEVGVRDDHPADPVVGNSPREAEAGRGMLLVSSLASRWGVRRSDGRAGKVVWFQIDPPAHEPGRVLLSG